MYGSSITIHLNRGKSWWASSGVVYGRVYGYTNNRCWRAPANYPFMELDRNYTAGNSTGYF